MDKNQDTASVLRPGGKLIGLLLFVAVSVSAQELRYDYNELLNCERSLLYQDTVVNEAIERTKGGGVLIVIVRSGTGEHSVELMRRRIYNVRRYFTEREAALRQKKVMVAAGDHVNGYGRLEYYLDGKLIERLLFPKNGYVCHSRCGPDEQYYPEKAIEDKRRKQKGKRRN